MRPPTQREQYYKPRVASTWMSILFERFGLRFTKEVNSFSWLTAEYKCSAGVLEWLGIGYYNEKNSRPRKIPERGFAKSIILAALADSCFISETQPTKLRNLPRSRGRVR